VYIIIHVGVDINIHGCQVDVQGYVVVAVIGIDVACGDIVDGVPGILGGCIRDVVVNYVGGVTDICGVDVVDIVSII